ncbi:hypothetical protein ASPCAL06043 [Aspergillus calidoustus]|uniref:Uncharacterized protein n=1 Tax=Aspergillus calidoustus TaxID=454130 RepID=A0A0U5G1B4_ASPCI|nr:hypothetical protein ASPCAL06043 [Aspergillus calidoustus]
MAQQHNLDPIPLDDTAMQNEIILRIFERQAGPTSTGVGENLALCLHRTSKAWQARLNLLQDRGDAVWLLLERTTVDFMATIVDSLEGAHTLRTLLQIVLAFLQTDPLDEKNLRLASTTLLELCIRLWLMSNIAIPPTANSAWQQCSDRRVWVDVSQTLRQHMEICFPRSTTIYDKVKLDKAFRLYDIQKISNFEIEWTDNLLEHLLVRDPADDKDPYTVSIFHHRQFLEYHAARPSTIYPQGFIIETLKTLDLLLPHDHRRTEVWYATLCETFELDPTACKNRRPMQREDRGLNSFSFWRDRLAILKETLDELEPRTVFHFWLDRRRPIQWATFWVAVLVLGLTVFFGLVQSVEGALQVYKAYHPATD